MPDMLVKLYDLPKISIISELEESGITIRPAIGPEKLGAVDWVQTIFNKSWASEVDVAFSHSPISCIVAVTEGKLVGFACYDATSKGYFGPTGVHPEYRGKGIGKGLLFAALQGMKHSGYAYAIIGAAGPVDFYTKLVGATVIPDSSPGIYRGLVK